jgi:hypothetical protein
MNTSDTKVTPYLEDVSIEGDYISGDSTAPTTTLSTSPASVNGNNGWFKSATSITLSSSEAGTTYYQWDSSGGAWATYSGSFSALSGNHTLYYYSKDSDNNTETANSRVIKVDTTAPSAFTLTSPSAGAWQSIQKPTLSWNASSDAVSGLSSYIVKIDGAVDKTVSSSTTSTQVANNMSNGSHTWQIIAEDNAGNQTSVSSRIINIDLSNPTASISSPASSAVLNGTVSIAGTATDSNFSSYLLEYGSGASPSTWIQITSSNSAVSSGTLGTLNTASLANGSYTIRLTVTDAAGKSTVSSVSVNVDNDSTAPTTTLSTSPASVNGNNGWFKSATSITLSSSEAGTTYYQWDSSGGAWATYSGSFSALSGNHTLYYYSKDSDNNTETANSRVIKVDTTAPSAFTLTSPSAGAWQSIQKPTLSWNASSDAVSGLSSYIVKIDGAVDKTVSSSTTSTQVANNMSNGSHTWQIIAEDNAGNQTSVSSRIINIDLSNPTASISSPASSAVLNGTVSIAGTATDSNFSSYLLEYGSGASPSTWIQITSSNSAVSSGTLGTLNTASLANGSYTIRLTVTDAAGKSTVSSVSVNVDNDSRSPSGDGSNDTPINNSGGGGGGGGGSGGGGAVEETIEAPQAESTQIKINNGEKIIGSNRVKLTFSVASNPIAIMLSNDGINWSQPQQYENTIMWNLLPGDGERSVYAKLHITVSNWSAPIMTKVVLDSTPPTLSISAEEVMFAAALSGASDKRFSVKANASDENGIEKIEFYLNDHLVETDIGSPYEYSLTANIKSDSTVRTIAYDVAGNRTTASKTLTSKQSGLFKDLPSDFWATQYVNGLNQKGIIGGFTDGSFKPNDNVTRAEFSKMIVNAMGWQLVTPENPSFSDVPTNHWCYSYIETARSHGVIDGYRDGTFRPNRNISRAEISKMTTQAAQLKTDNSGTSFKDVEDSFWARDYIVTAKNYSIVSGYRDGSFRPEARATRAEATKMIYSLLQQ